MILSIPHPASFYTILKLNPMLIGAKANFSLILFLNESDIQYAIKLPCLFFLIHDANFYSWKEVCQTETVPSLYDLQKILESPCIEGLLQAIHNVHVLEDSLFYVISCLAELVKHGKGL